MDEYRSLDALAEALGAWIDAIPVRCRGGAGISRVVAVTGPPGMGKTTACLRLSAIDPDVSVVHLDEYLRERSFRRSRGLSPFDLLAWEHERASSTTKRGNAGGGLRGVLRLVGPRRNEVYDSRQ